MTVDVVTYREFCNEELCGKTIGGYTFPPLSSYPSMRDNIVEWDPATKKAVVDYLRATAFYVGASTSANKRDVFTGDEIPFTGDQFQDEAGFTWRDYLSYYVDTYNVGLPDDFVKHVLKVS